MTSYGLRLLFNLFFLDLCFLENKKDSLTTQRDFRVAEE